MKTDDDDAAMPKSMFALPTHLRDLLDRYAKERGIKKPEAVRHILALFFASQEDGHLSSQDALARMAEVAGQQAGNRNAREHGREAWSGEDFRIAGEAAGRMAARLAEIWAPLQSKGAEPDALTSTDVAVEISDGLATPRVARRKRA